MPRSGPFTVFAPTDAAFNALPEDVKEKLKDKKILTDVLLFHLYDGNFNSGMIKNELKIDSKLKGVMIRFNTYGKVRIGPKFKYSLCEQSIKADKSIQTIDYTNSKNQSTS